MRLPEVSIDDINKHMSNPRVAEHMPLLTFKWNSDVTSKFIEAKEDHWRRHGLGQWAILFDGTYVGWGGFQNEDGAWDFGLVLKPDAFGLGPCIARKAIEFAMKDERIPFVTFLLAPSRKSLGGLERLDAKFVGDVYYNGAKFLKFRLETK